MPELFKKKKPTTINQGALTPEEVVNMARTFTPGTPGVNIIPNRVMQNYKLNDLKKRFIAAGTALVLVLVGLWGATAVFHFDKHPDYDNVVAQTEEINAQSQALAPYQQFYTSVDRKRQDLGAMLTTDVATGDLLALLQNAAAQSGVTLTTLSISSPQSSTDGGAGDGQASACPSPDPFQGSATSGCISFSGRAGDRESISRFVDTLNATPGLVNAYVPTTTVGSGEGGVSSQVTGTVSFTQEMYSNKYASLTLPLSSILNPTTDENTSGEEGTTDEATTTTEEGQ